MFKLLKKIVGKDKEFVKKGHDYFKNGNYVLALNYYRMALDINENNEEAIEGINKIRSINAYNRALKSFLNGHYKSARKNLEESLSYYNYEKSIQLLNMIDEIENAISNIISLKENLKKEYRYEYIEEIIFNCEKILSLNKGDKIAKKILKEFETLKKMLSQLDQYISIKDCGNSKKIVNYLMEHYKEYPAILNYLNKIYNDLLIYNSKRTYKEALREYTNENYEKALKLLESIKEICGDNPKFNELYNKTTEIIKYIDEYHYHFKNGDYELCKEYLENIIKLNPNTVYIEQYNIINEIIKILERAQQYYHDKNYIKAISTISEVLKLNPDDKKTNEFINKIYNIFIKKINKMDVNNYKDIFNEIKNLLNYNNDLIYKYVEKLEELISYADESKYLELIDYYWKVTGGNGLELGLDLEGDICDIYYSYEHNKVFVFVKEPNILYCINGENYEVFWKLNYRNEKYIFKLYNDLILLGYESGIVECINIKSGEVLWKYETWNRVNITDILPSNKFLYVGCKYGHLYKISLNDGQQLCSYNLGKDIYKLMPIDDKNIVVTCGNKQILHSPWDVHIIYSTYNSMYSLCSFNLPYITDIKIYKKYNYLVVGTSTGEVYCISTKNGTILWNTKLDKYIGSMYIDEDNDYVVVGTDDLKYRKNYSCRICALSINNGKILWNKILNSIGIEYITKIEISSNCVNCNDINNNINKNNNINDDIINKDTNNINILVAKGRYNPYRKITPIYYISEDGNILNKFRSYGNIIKLSTTEKCPKGSILSINI